MRSTRTAVALAVAVAATAATSVGGGAAATRTAQADRPVGGRSAQADLIERFTVRLDPRCHVAVLRMRLSRPVPVGIVVDRTTRVPLGRASVSSARSARTTVTDAKI